MSPPPYSNFNPTPDGPRRGPSKTRERDSRVMSTPNTSGRAARTRRDRGKVTFEWPAPTLPDGAMIRTAAGPALLLGDAALSWTPSGYGAARPRPPGTVAVLTPAPIVELYRAGLSPALHPTAR